MELEKWKEKNKEAKKYAHFDEKKRISCKNLYEEYTVKGSRKKGNDGKIKGNFITYVQRAQKIYGDEEHIDQKTRRHMLKVRRKLDNIV